MGKFGQTDYRVFEVRIFQAIGYTGETIGNIYNWKQ